MVQELDTLVALAVQDKVIHVAEAVVAPQDIVVMVVMQEAAIILVLVKTVQAAVEAAVVRVLQALDRLVAEEYKIKVKDLMV